MMRGAKDFFGLKYTIFGGVGEGVKKYLASIGW